MGMSKPKLDGLIESLAAQEDQAINAIRAKYESQSQMYKDALDKAKQNKK